MARPKKDAEGLAARERIVEAFWRLIEQKPYSDITIRGLCAMAQVNPNTFYRYFACMDDLAKRAFEENLVDGFPRMLMGLRGEVDEDVRSSGTPHGDEYDDGGRAGAGALHDTVREKDGGVFARDCAEAGVADCRADDSRCVSSAVGQSAIAGDVVRFSRMRLFAQNGSDFLLGILRNAWVGAWLAEAGKTPDELTREQRIDLLMVAGAEMALAGLGDGECGIDDFLHVLDRPLGQALLATLEGIAKR